MALLGGLWKASSTTAPRALWRGYSTAAIADKATFEYQPLGKEGFMYKHKLDTVVTYSTPLQSKSIELAEDQKQHIRELRRANPKEHTPVTLARQFRVPVEYIQKIAPLDKETRLKLAGNKGEKPDIEGWKLRHTRKEWDLWERRKEIRGAADAEFRALRKEVQLMHKVNFKAMEQRMVDEANRVLAVKKAKREKLEKILAETH